MKYYSQYKQDKVLDEELFKKKEKGFFVEVGAVDGIHLSNTLFFERERGWNGICIEPSPVYYSKLEESGRKCFFENCAISNKNEEVDFLAIEGYGLGLSGIIDNYSKKHQKRIENEIKEHNSKQHFVKVQAIKLQDLFDKHNISHVDFCSIDIEGGELNALKSIDFSKTYIDCIMIENNYGIKKEKKLLKEKGYVFWKQIGIDAVFVHKDKKLKKESWMNSILNIFK